MPGTTPSADLFAQLRSPLDTTIAPDYLLEQNPLVDPSIVSSLAARSSFSLGLDEEDRAPNAITSGYFTVGSTGQVSVDYLFDGGGYEGELAIFSLSGLEAFATDLSTLTQEIVRRALSDTTEGHVVIRDVIDGARFTGELGEANFNAGTPYGVKTFTMTAGEHFGVVLTPNGTIAALQTNPNPQGVDRPLFSLVGLNPEFGFQVGQIADVDGNGSTFVLEDQRVDGASDRDYNDLIFRVSGAIGTAISLADVIPSDNDWQELALGQTLLDYAAAYDNPRLPQPIRYDFPLANQPLIGIIDTGFSGNNPDIDYSRITLGRDLIDNDADPLLAPGTGNEHGTHILGLIGATQDNGVGIDGINDQAPLWVGRAIGSGKWAESLTEFVDRARQDGQPNAVVNLSLDLTQKNPDGSTSTRYEFTPEERKAIEYARQNGVILVVAAGNDGGVMSALGQASQEFDNIITVGAAIGNDRAFYSSYGAGLDILAPGGTKDAPVYSSVGDGLGTMAGTSVATAEVTGAISQVWAANPGLSYRQAIEILKVTATDLKEPGWDVATGAGLLNLERAVELALQTPPETYQPTGWIAPTTWQGMGTLLPEERAARGGVSRDQAFFMAAEFSDSDTLSAAVPKRYYKVAIDKPGYYEWTVTRTNGMPTIPSVGLLDGTGKPAGQRFLTQGVSLSGGVFFEGAESETEGVFVNPGIYYIEVGSKNTGSYKLETKWKPDFVSVATQGNAVFNPQGQFSNQQDRYQPFAATSGVVNALNVSGTVTYKFGDESKQYANYQFEVSEPGQLTLNVNSPNGQTVVWVKKFVGQGSQAEGITGGGRVVSPNQPYDNVLNLNAGRYEIEVSPYMANDPSFNFLTSVVNRSYTLNATFARTAPKPGEGKVPSGAGVLTETVSSNGVTTHYYANGYLTIQPSGVATWYSKGLWATVTPVNPVGQNLPATPTVSSAPPAIPTPTPTPISDPDGDETMAKAKNLAIGPLRKTQKGQIGGASDEFDFYKFTLTEPQWVQLGLDGVSQGHYMLLWDSQDHSDNGDKSEDTITMSRILSPGTYYVQIDKDFKRDEKTAYRLKHKQSEIEGRVFRGRWNEAYVIENGKRWIVPSTEVGRYLNRNWDTIDKVSQDDLDQIPLGGIYKPVWQRQIESKYDSTAGMLGSSLGSIAVAGKSPDGTTGYFQRFNTGSIHWSAKHGAVAVWHDIQRVYEQNGGTGGKLGFPTKQEHDWEGGKRTDFEGGYIFFTDRLGPQVYYNGETPWQKEIANEYGITQNLLGNYGGGPSPTGTSFNGTKGYWSSYDRGTIHWSAKYGAVAVWQELQQIYNSTGGSGGWLGFPTQREQDWETGKRTEFEGGFIFWTPQLGARAYRHGETPILTPPNNGGSNGKPTAEVWDQTINTSEFFNTVLDPAIGTESFVSMKNRFRWSDPDGDNIQAVAFYDSSPGDRGYFAASQGLYGVPVPPNYDPNKVIVVDPNDLDQTFYGIYRNHIGTSDRLGVAVFDGSQWSDLKEFNITVPANNAGGSTNNGGSSPGAGSSNNDDNVGGSINPGSSVAPVANDVSMKAEVNFALKDQSLWGWGQTFNPSLNVAGKLSPDPWNLGIGKASFGLDYKVEAFLSAGTFDVDFPALFDISYVNAVQAGSSAIVSFKPTLQAQGNLRTELGASLVGLANLFAKFESSTFLLPSKGVEFGAKFDANEQLLKDGLKSPLILDIGLGINATKMEGNTLKGDDKAFQYIDVPNSLAIAASVAAGSTGIGAPLIPAIQGIREGMKVAGIEAKIGANIKQESRFEVKGFEFDFDGQSNGNELRLGLNGWGSLNVPISIDYRTGQVYKFTPTIRPIVEFSTDFSLSGQVEAGFNLRNLIPQLPSWVNVEYKEWRETPATPPISTGKFDPFALTGFRVNLPEITLKIA
jgi:hypothetical protein